MKTIIAVLASIAFATPAFAALPSAPGNEQLTVKANHLVQLAAGTQRSTTTTTSRGESNKGSMKGGKSTYSGR